MSFDDLSELGAVGGGGLSDDRRPLWIAADEAWAASEASAAGEAARLRVARTLTLRQALGDVDLRPFGGTLMIELGDREADDEDALLGLVEEQGRDAALPAVIAFPTPALDRVAARVSAPHVTLLCAPTRAERVAALALAHAGPALHFAEADTITEAMRLQRLAEEVGRIARSLAGLAEAGGDPAAETVSEGLIGYRAGATPIAIAAPVQQVVRAEDVRTLIRLRRQRDRLFAGELFADPAWDMMLDLMAARIERLRVAVSSLCIAAAVPATTALRWIKTLTDVGVFVRVADPTDKRRVFIELSDGAAKALLGFLGEAKRAGVGVV